MTSSVVHVEADSETDPEPPAGPDSEPDSELGDPALSRHEFARLGQELERMSAPEILAWAFERWGSKVALCTSFQAGGMVLLDMAWRIDPAFEVFTLDTGRLPQETYDLIDRIRTRYRLRVEVVYPDPIEIATLVSEHGPNLFFRSIEQRLECCRVRKVEPLRRALRGRAAWITGLRRQQSASRANVRKIERDTNNGGSGESSGLVKLNPLADWSEEQVWSYLREASVPVHSLYRRGYTSIGCAPCTRPVQLGEGSRSGRWWWERQEHKECGLHFKGDSLSESVAEAAAGGRGSGAG